MMCGKWEPNDEAERRALAAKRRRFIQIIRPPHCLIGAETRCSNRLLADQVVVRRMCADPKPENAAFNVSAKYSVLVSDAS